ncbi:phage terminase large subunit [Arenimonas sp.]|uniref:phage terminase large subunit n=1 Tax=Arenimonas sp. TaxID=1872635 RepID=UPI0039E53EB1
MAVPDAPVRFLVFFLLWAKVQKWTVPLLHVRICVWLEECEGRIRVLMVFRGAAKSTIYAVWKAYQLYRDRSWRSLVYAADDKLAGKLTRDTLNILRRHPLCGGMLPPMPAARSFWVNGSTDARNPSMEAVGINSNATGSRADDADFDDVEVPKNIKTVEARQSLRTKAEEATHILVPGGRKTFIGTPHTHDSLYIEQIEGGATVLKIPLFEHVKRYENTDSRRRYRFDFTPGEDGLYVMLGIGKPSRIGVEGIDYQVEGNEVVFAQPPHCVLDICAGCAWPERFTREEIQLKRRETRTLNAWDSQYMLEAKPVEEVRLDPEKITPYDVEPTIRHANGAVAMNLGGVRIVGAAFRWDPASGKLRSDVSAGALVLQDEAGRRYWHRAEAFTGELAEFGPDGKTIIGGQVWQIAQIVRQFNLPRVTVETNGIGQFAPGILRACLKQQRLPCAVKEEPAVANKNTRILETLEPLLLAADQLWAHSSVLDGPLWDQMKDWKPAVKEQPDDYLDAGAGAISETPERFGKQIAAVSAPAHGEWRESGGTHEVVFEG